MIQVPSEIVSPERGEVRVVGWRGVGDAPLAAGVHVAQVVRQRLKLVGGQLGENREVFRLKS